MPDVASVPLRDGHRIPQLGLGVYKVASEETERVVRDAIEVGYRHIDTATLYGNEAGVGRAVRASGLARDELFVTTKVWNSDQGFDATLAAFDRSLAELGLDYVDLYLIHWPAPSLGLASETWRAFERIAGEGRARSIGVSNFLPHHLEALLEHTATVPALNQIEVNPYLQQRAAQQADAAHDIVTAAWSPLARGRVLDDRVIERIAERHGVDAGAVVIAWHLHQGRVVIPKTTSRARMATNLAAAELRLSDQELASIDALESGARSGSDPDRVGLTR